MHSVAGGRVASTHAQDRAWSQQAPQEVLASREDRARSWRREWCTCLLAYMVLGKEILNEI